MLSYGKLAVKHLIRQPNGCHLPLKGKAMRLEDLYMDNMVNRFQKKASDSEGDKGAVSAVKRGDCR
jgi:hypothetical protein